MTTTRLLSHVIGVLWLTLAVTCLALVATTHLATAFGYRTVIIEGPSMTPAIPVGALVIERLGPVSELAAGDVVTMRMPNGVLITHRVIRTVTLDGIPMIETQGDANDAPDPALVPASDVVGTVQLSLPMAGYALAFISLPTGMAAVFSALAALVCASWLLEDAQPRRRRVRIEPVDGVSDGISA